MSRTQAGVVAAALLLSLSACSMRNEWTDDATYSGEQRRESAGQNERNSPTFQPPSY